MLRMGSVKKNLLNAAFAIVIFLLPAHMFATTLGLHLYWSRIRNHRRKHERHLRQSSLQRKLR